MISFPGGGTGCSCRIFIGRSDIRRSTKIFRSIMGEEKMPEGTHHFCSRAAFSSGSRIRSSNSFLDISFARGQSKAMRFRSGTPRTRAYSTAMRRLRVDFPL